MRFSNGTRAKVETGGFELLPGKEYLLCLVPIEKRFADAFDKETSAYQIIGFTGGVFETGAPDRKVHTLTNDDVNGASGADVNEFLRMARSVVLAPSKR